MYSGENMGRIVRNGLLFMQRTEKREARYVLLAERNHFVMSGKRFVMSG